MSNLISHYNLSLLFVIQLTLGMEKNLFPCSIQQPFTYLNSVNMSPSVVLSID